MAPGTNMASSGISDDVQQRHLGLPAHLLSTSLLTWDGISDVTRALQLAVSSALPDLACGRGGYGLEVPWRGKARMSCRSRTPRAGLSEHSRSSAAWPLIHCHADEGELVACMPMREVACSFSRIRCQPPKAPAELGPRYAVPRGSEPPPFGRHGSELLGAVFIFTTGNGRSANALPDQ